MFDQHHAIVRLLRDNDPDTISLLKHQFIERGPEIIPHLRDLVAVDDATVSAHAHEILTEIENRQALEDFSLHCQFFADGGAVEPTCWLLARVLRPGLEIEPYVRQLDAWGTQLTERLERVGGLGVVPARRRVGILTELLAGDLGFRGNAEQYYDVANSLLPNVVETRMGIPISLSILYMAVASRAGLIVDGINLPGHFIVRHGDVFFDPFHKGKILQTADCEAILRKQKLAYQATFLEAASGRMILTRVLANLLYIYQDAGDESQHARVSGWLKALERK